MEKDKILALVMSPVHLPFNKSQVGTYQNTCIIQLKYHVLQRAKVAIII